MDAGVFWESLNFACLKRLPVLFVCEDNDLAVHVFAKNRQGFDSMIDLISQYNCVALEAEGTDVEQVHQLSVQILGLMKERNQPGFLHLKCYRYLEHVGVKEDFHVGYRSKEDFDSWFQRDPILVQRRKLLELGIQELEIVDIEQSLDKQAEEGVESAKTADFPDTKELFKGVFYGE